LCTPETQYKEGAAIFVHRKLKNFAAACLALRTRTVASFWTVARRYILGQETMHFFLNDLTSAKQSTCEGDFLALLHGASFSFAT
jgi:hypothetical protein